jgi:hypothetical protein
MKLRVEGKKLDVESEEDRKASASLSVALRQSY